MARNAKATAAQRIEVEPIFSDFGELEHVCYLLHAQAKVWELFLTGKHGKTRDGAAEKIAPIFRKSFSVTRRYLQGDAPADVKAKA